MIALKSTIFWGSIGTRVPAHTASDRSWINRLFQGIARHRRINRDYDMLLEMPDYLLHDLGLTRFETRRERRLHNKVLPLWPL